METLYKIFFLAPTFDDLPTFFSYILIDDRYFLCEVNNISRQVAEGLLWWSDRRQQPQVKTVALRFFEPLAMSGLPCQSSFRSTGHC